MAIKNVVSAIAVIVAANVTLANSETKPTNDQQSGFFAITFEESGRFEARASGWAQSFHAVSSYIMGPRANMKQTFTTLEGECENICAAILADPTLGGNCDTFGDVGYAIANLEQAGVKYIGYKLTVNEIKIGRSL